MSLPALTPWGLRVTRAAGWLLLAMGSGRCWGRGGSRTVFKGGYS